MGELYRKTLNWLDNHIIFKGKTILSGCKSKLVEDLRYLRKFHYPCIFVVAKARFYMMSGVKIKTQGTCGEQGAYCMNSYKNRLSR